MRFGKSYIYRFCIDTFIYDLAVSLHILLLKIVTEDENKFLESALMTSIVNSVFFVMVCPPQYYMSYHD